MILHEDYNNGQVTTKRDIGTKPCTYEYLTAEQGSFKQLNTFNGNIFYETRLV